MVSSFQCQGSVLVTPFDSTVACDLAEYDDVCHCITADAVAAVDAAYNFACGEEAGDCIAVGINDFGAGVDMDTAHGVMDAGSDLDRIVGSLAQIHLHTGCASEIRIIFICNVFVPVAECFCKGLGIHIDLFCQILDGFTFYSNVCGNIFFRCLETFAESLVEDDICRGVSGRR